jgi:hypothetical protein
MSNRPMAAHESAPQPTAALAAPATGAPQIAWVIGAEGSVPVTIVRNSALAQIAALNVKVPVAQ